MIHPFDRHDLHRGAILNSMEFQTGGVLSISVELDEDPISGAKVTGEPEPWLEEDFSVYVAPKSTPLAPIDGPILRIEPTLALVSWPLGVFFFLDFGLYVRLQLDGRNLGFAMDRVAFVLALVVTTLIAAAPFFYSSSYFAELYEDRLVVRRGTREWATPLADIVKIELLPCPVGGASDLYLLRLLATARASGRYSSWPASKSLASDAPQPMRPSSLHAYLVSTSFETAFWIPPFVGHEEFATAVLQQQGRVLAQRPPVVRGTVYEDPQAES